ncbi:hypothetical protein [Streptomyces rochei]
MKRNITPETFSGELRPTPITVGGQAGPRGSPWGGAQTTAVDIALLTAGAQEERGYEARLRENRGPPAGCHGAEQRARRHRPLLPRLVDEAVDGTPPGARPVACSAHLRALMRELLRFRLPHLRLAKANTN